MRENTFIPGNFSTSYKSTKQKVAETINRLSYDPYERRQKRHMAEMQTGNRCSHIVIVYDICYLQPI